jgi:hypothetical protein
MEALTAETSGAQRTSIRLRALCVSAVKIL